MENYHPGLAETKSRPDRHDEEADAGVPGLIDERPDRATSGPMSAEAVVSAGADVGQEVIFDATENTQIQTANRRAALESLLTDVLVNRRDAVEKFKERLAKVLDSIPESFQYLLPDVNSQLIESAKEIDENLRSAKSGEKEKLTSVFNDLNLLTENVRTALAINKRMEKLSGFIKQEDMADLAGQLNLAMLTGYGGIDKDLLADLEEDLAGFEKAYRTRMRAETSPKYQRPVVEERPKSSSGNKKDEVQLKKQTEIQQLRTDLQSLQAGYDKTVKELVETYQYDPKTGNFNPKKGWLGRMVGNVAKSLGVGKVSGLVEELATLSDRMSKIRQELRRLELGSPVQMANQGQISEETRGQKEDIVTMSANVIGSRLEEKDLVDQPTDTSLVLKRKSISELSSTRNNAEDVSESSKNDTSREPSLDRFSSEELKNLSDLVLARVEAEWPNFKKNLAEAVLAEEYSDMLDILANKIIFFSLEMTLRKHGGRRKVDKQMLDRMANVSDYFASQALKDIIVSVHNKGAQQHISWAEQLKVWYPYFGDQTMGKQKLRRLRLEKGIASFEPQELAGLINNRLIGVAQRFDEEQEIRQAA